MTVWLSISVVAIAAILWLARPFIMRGQIEPNETEVAISIYRGQLDELERDERRGLISAADRTQARREIESRAARAARRLDAGIAIGRRAPLMAVGVATGSSVLAIAAYLWLGAPGLPDQPIVERRAAAVVNRAAAGDQRAIAALALRDIAEMPEGFEKSWALAKARTEMGDHAAAAEAYRRAAEASGDSPGVLAAYAEALTLANGNKVPPAARIVLQQVLQQAPLEPRARYYNALAKAQAQDFEGALEDWYALYVQSAPDAPWVDRVRQDIVNMARFTGRDLAAMLPDASAEELALAARGRPQPATTADRVAALRKSLDEDPKQHARALELADLLAGEGDKEAAVAVLDAAKDAYAGAPFVLQELTNARQRIAGVAGPSEEEVAAAAAMTEADRDEMIAGMVQSLADRLSEEPNDIEGWLMLIRSYAVLQRREAGETAVSQALQAFDRTSPEGQRIIRTAADHGLLSPEAGTLE